MAPSLSHYYTTLSLMDFSQMESGSAAPSPTLRTVYKIRFVFLNIVVKIIKLRDRGHSITPWTTRGREGVIRFT